MAEAIEHPKLPVSDKYVAITNELRWSADGRLQQKFVISYFGEAPGHQGIEVEWRDVPTEAVEEKPKRKGK